MYKVKNLSLLAYSGIFSLFCYQTDEPSKAVEQPGYFQGEAQLRKDNILYIRSKDKNSMYKVVDDKGTVADMLIGPENQPAAEPTEPMDDVLLNEISDKFDSQEVNENFDAIETTLNEILAALRQAKIIAS